MRDERTGVVIVFNGEVYNFAELRRELVKLGQPLRSTGDTEAILAAYARWGESIIRRLRGMFSMALFDPRDETVLFVRDRLGIKPLYLAPHDGGLLFASELRALLASERIDRKLDPRALAGFLWHGFVPGPGTLVEGVRLLPAGTTLRVGLDGSLREPRRYWQIPAADPDDDEDRAVRALADTAAESVALRLVADVPVGIFLSGGVDSSVIAALAKRHARTQLATFTVRFEEEGWDESPHARRIADALGTEHHEVTLRGADLLARLDEALGALDQPTFDALNTYFVSRAVREAGVKVALAGVGGDELFGGYASFVDLPRARRIAARLEGVPDAALRRLTTVASKLMSLGASEVPPQTRWGKLGDVLATRGDLLALHQTSYALFTRDLTAQLRAAPAPDLDWGLDPTRAAELRELVSTQPELAAISTLELSSFVGERLLRDIDAASMAVSLEVRVPLLDHHFVAAVARVPEPRRFVPARKKRLLAELAQPELDPGLFDRPKAGFELPLERWCRGSLKARIKETFGDLALARRVGLDGEALSRVWRTFEKNGPGVYWSRVWGLFVWMSFCQAHRVYL
jgi:asparagine synthase (glutamine-hydrolysing)